MYKPVLDAPAKQGWDLVRRAQLDQPKAHAWVVLLEPADSAIKSTVKHGCEEADVE